jgi:hypothetical protein
MYTLIGYYAKPPAGQAILRVPRNPTYCGCHTKEREWEGRGGEGRKDDRQSRFPLRPLGANGNGRGCHQGGRLRYPPLRITHCALQYETTCSLGQFVMSLHYRVDWISARVRLWKVSTTLASLLRHVLSALLNARSEWGFRGFVSIVLMQSSVIVMHHSWLITRHIGVMRLTVCSLIIGCRTKRAHVCMRACTHSYLRTCLGT